ncbi:MAG: hypothetical protein ABI542_08800 [Gemmatimonadota bacterium]
MISISRPMTLALGLLALSCKNPPADPIIPPPPPPAARFTLVLREGAVQRISQGEVLALTLLATRDVDYTGAIAFSATAPEGVLMVFRPPTILSSEETQIRLVVDNTAERTLHRITLRGTDNVGATRDVVLELTVDEGS